MEKFNVIVILRNGDLFGVWSFPQELSVSKKNDIKHAVKEKVKALNAEAMQADVFTVAFDDTFPTDDISEMLEGILETIDNVY